jgi:hypothetical protein
LVAHSRTVESEFKRQAREFSRSPDLGAAVLIEPILRAGAELHNAIERLREREGRLRFTYRWGFLVAASASPTADSGAGAGAGAK